MDVQIGAIEGDPCRSEPPISDPWLGMIEPPRQRLGFREVRLCGRKKRDGQGHHRRRDGCDETSRNSHCGRWLRWLPAPVQSHPFGRLRRCDSSLPKQEVPLPPQERDAAPCVLAWPTEAHGGSRPCLQVGEAVQKHSLLVFLCIRTHHRCAGR